MIRTWHVSHPGLVRRGNEDCMLLNEVLVADSHEQAIAALDFPGGTHAFLVADGMGGHRKGEVASDTVLQIFRDTFRSARSEDDIGSILVLAKRCLNGIAEANPAFRGFGSTVTGMIFLEDTTFVLNCGDSRTYRISGASLEKLTRDHSLVQEYVDRGVIAEGDMRLHPQKHIITSALIGDLNETMPAFDIRRIPVAAGERFLICSDGLWESLSPTEMSACIAGATGVDIVRCLFTRTMEKGAGDNISIIVIET